MISILIPFTPDRQELLDQITFALAFQCGGIVSIGQIMNPESDIIMSLTTYENGVELILCKDEKKYSIGYKRNLLLKYVTADYCAFVDSDDMISPNYIETLLKGIETNPDCISLKGIITEDGNNPQYFEHSIKYDKYETTNGFIKYLRFPNHLNCIRSSIAKQFKFPETNHGEDTDFATQIHNSGLLKYEYYTDVILYHYQYKKNK